MRTLPWSFWASLWVLAAISLLWALRPTGLDTGLEPFEVPLVNRTFVQGPGTRFYLLDGGAYIPVTQEDANRLLIREKDGTPVQLLAEAVSIQEAPEVPTEKTLRSVLGGSEPLQFHGRNGPISVLPERPTTQPLPEVGATSDLPQLPASIPEAEPVRGAMPIIPPEGSAQNDAATPPPADGEAPVVEPWVGYAPF